MYIKKVNAGYYTTTCYYDKCLKYCPSGSAGIVYSKDGTVSLVSYKTRVISIDAEGWLDCTGTYSATTRKHIAAFLKEIAPCLNYYSVKAIAGTDERMNIYTGEIKAA